MEKSASSSTVREQLQSGINNNDNKDYCLCCYRALGNCDLFVLTKHDFESALAKYPNVAEKVVAVATERANVVVLTDVIVNDSLFEGKSKSETAETLFEVSSQGL